MPSFLIIADENPPEEQILASRRILAKYFASMLRVHPVKIVANPDAAELEDASCIVFSSPETFLRLAHLPDIGARNIAIAGTLLDCVSMNMYHDGQRKAVSVLAPLIAASLAAAGTPSTADAEELQRLRSYRQEIVDFLGTDNVFGVVNALKSQITLPLPPDAVPAPTFPAVEPPHEEAWPPNPEPESNPVPPVPPAKLDAASLADTIAKDFASVESLGPPDVTQTLKGLGKQKK
jgi:hypothetical protein